MSSPGHDVNRDLPPDSDIEIAAAMARGDPSASMRVYETHAPTVARVVSRMGIDGADVEDLVQATFLEAFRVSRTFEGRSSLRSWLVGIALNHARHFVRTRVRERDLALHHVGSEERQCAEMVLVEVEELRWLRSALDQLPPLQREALVLCELQELSAREVSEAVGAPPATVWRRVHDAKVSLRRLLGERRKQEEP